MPMPGSQRGLLDKALAALNTFAINAHAATGAQVLQVNVRMPSAPGKGEAPGADVIFLWDDDADEFTIQT